MRVGGVVRVLVPLCALFLLWMIFYIAVGHVGTVLALFAFVALVLVPNRLHRPNGSGV
jgi:hypothetical protein